MMLGGLGDGCGELRAGLRQPSGIPRLFASGGITAGITFRRCWCRTRSGAAGISRVGISARAMQRFLTEARWSDETGIGRLQEYLAPRLGSPGGPATSPSRAGNRAGQGGQLPGWDVPGLRQPAGPGVGGPQLPSAQELDLCAAAGAPEDRREPPVQDGVTLELLERVLELGQASGPSGLPETTPSGCRRPSGRDWRPWGCATWTFRAYGQPLEAWTGPEYPGFGRPRKPKLRPGRLADHGAARSTG